MLFTKIGAACSQRKTLDPGFRRDDVRGATNLTIVTLEELSTTEAWHSKHHSPQTYEHRKTANLKTVIPAKPGIQCPS